jgi:hypothetical protein
MATATLTDHRLVGKRVQLPPWDGTWMRGDRFGAITGVSLDRNRVYVTTDKAHATRWYPLDDVDRFVTWVD